MPFPTQSPATLLAQQRGVPPEFWLWLGLLIVATILAGMVVLFLRRRLLDSREPGAGSGTMMEELRAMRDRGEISEAEYDQTRRAIVARASGRDPTRPEGAVDWAGESGRRARPGFDLTGEPLPGHTPQDPDPPADED